MKHLFSCSAFIAGLLALLPAAFAQSSPLTLSSPDQQLVVHFGTGSSLGGTGGGKLVYSATFRGKPILDDSALGLELAGQPALGSDVRVVDSKSGSGVDDYTLSNQKVSKVRDAYNSVTIHLEESGAGHRILFIEARAYNGGLAFRYLLPQQDAIKQLQLRQEV